MGAKAWLLSLVVASTAMAAPSTPDISGTVIGEFNGVPAYSNGIHTGTGGGSLDYQCVAYPIRYDKQKNGVSFSPFYGKMEVAKQIFPLVRDRKIAGYTSFDNGGLEMPQPGDWLCFSNEADPSRDSNPKGSNGHVAMVMSLDVEKGLLKIIEQNWPPQTQAIRDIPFKIVDGNYTVLNRYNERCQGWCRYVGETVNVVPPPVATNSVATMPKEWPLCNQPISIYLLIDCSAGFGEQNLARAKAAVMGMIGVLNSDQVQLGIGKLSDFTQGVMPVLPATEAKSKLAETLTGITVGGSANIADGIKLGLEQLRGKPNSNIVLFSAGTSSTNELAAQIDAAQKAKVPIHVVGAASGQDENYLVDIAAGSGGVYASSEVNNVAIDIASVVSACRHMTLSTCLIDRVKSGKFDRTFNLSGRSDVMLFFATDKNVSVKNLVICDPQGKQIKSGRNAGDMIYLEATGQTAGTYSVQASIVGSGWVDLLVANKSGDVGGNFFIFRDTHIVGDQDGIRSLLRVWGGKYNEVRYQTYFIWPSGADIHPTDPKVGTTVCGPNKVAYQIYSKTDRWLRDVDGHDDPYNGDGVYADDRQPVTCPGPVIALVWLPNGQKIVNSYWVAEAGQGDWNGPTVGQLKSALGIQ